MNTSIYDILTRDNGYLYLVLFGIFVSAMIFRENMSIYVTIILGVCLIYRDEIRSMGKHRGFPKRKINQQQHIRNTEITLTQTSRDILKQLNKYSVYNPNAYRRGKRYLHMFFDQIQRFSSSNNTKHVIENAEMYSQQSIKLFRTLVFSIPETKYGSETTQDTKETLSELCERLEKHVYNILYNKVQIHNRDFKDNPNIDKCEIVYDTDNVKEYNYYHENELS